MVWCSVVGCKNNSKAKIKKEHIKFHKFPKDNAICKEWIAACGKENINLLNAKICSVHFSEDSYLLKDRLLNTSAKKKHLQSNAIPTEFLPVKKKISDRDTRAEKRTRKNLVETLLMEHK